jgi:hypothetical protein
MFVELHHIGGNIRAKHTLLPKGWACAKDLGVRIYTVG